MKLRCTNPTLLLYLAWVYAIPAILNSWLDYKSEIYVNPSIGVTTWLYGLLLFLIVAVFAFRLEGSCRYSRFHPLIVWRIPEWLIVGVLMGVLVISALGAYSGLSRWRYAAEGLSSSLDSMSLLFVLAPNVLELILFSLLFFHYKLSSWKLRFILLLLTLCLGLSASGIGPMFIVLLSLLAAIAPVAVRGIILRPELTTQQNVSKTIWKRLFWVFPLVLTLASGAYIVGDAIKTGVGLIEAAQNIGQEEISFFVNYLVGRISVQWYSVMATLHDYVELNSINPLNNLMAPVVNAGFRISSLTGGWLNIERPLDGSLSRINYLLINLYPFNDREGTTPGLISTFILTFPVWLGPFALAGYLWFYDKIQSGLRRRFAGQATLFGEILLLNFTGVFFASPADLLLIFDPMLLTLFALCYLGLSARSERLPNAVIQASH